MLTVSPWQKVDLHRFKLYWISITTVTRVKNRLSLKVNFINLISVMWLKINKNHKTTRTWNVLPYKCPCKHMPSVARLLQ